MKKLLFIALGAATLAGITSCSNEDEMLQLPSGEGQTFVINMPGELRGRSFGDGATASQLTYAVYETGSQVPLKEGTATFSDLTATVNLNLVNGRSYDIVFWAAAPSAPYTFDAATQSITIDYTDVKVGNDENRDAFFKTEAAVAVDGPMQRTITLTRPFAQINFGTSDLDEVASLGFTDLKTSLSVKAYKTLNLVDGNVGDETDVVFDMTELPDAAAEAFPVQGYDYLSMNYLLMPADKETNDVSLKVSSFANGTERELKTVALSAVPMQRNYRTNIYGALLTSDVNWTVTINPDWTDPDINRPGDVPAGKVVADGKTFDSIEAALDGASGEVKLTLGEGDFALPAVVPAGVTSLDIEGMGGSKVVFPASGNVEAADVAVAMSNVTFSKSTGANNGFKGAASETFTNVKFVDGAFYPMSTDVTIDGCEFTVNPSVTSTDDLSKYALRFQYRGAIGEPTLVKAVVRNTVFNTHMGTAVTAYNSASDITFDNCLFMNKYEGDALKDAQSAIVYASATPDGEFPHTLTMINCGQSGFLGHYLSDSKLWACKTGQMTKVTIDGVEQTQPIVRDGNNYRLYTASALGLVATAVNDGFWKDGKLTVETWRGATLSLESDIDMAGVEFTPIGMMMWNPSKAFCGTFDGKNHTISNLTASDNTPNYASAGLFGALIGKCLNLTLKDVEINSTHYAGGIAGYVDNETGSLIDNCKVIGGTITTATEQIDGGWDNGDKAGGILGYGCIAKDKVTNCHVEDVTIKGYRHCGSIVGYANTIANVTGNTALNVTLVWDNTHDYKNFGTTIGKNIFGEIVGNGTADSSNTATGVTLPTE